MRIFGIIETFPIGVIIGKKRSFEVFQNVLKVRFYESYRYNVNFVEKQRNSGKMFRKPILG